MVCSFKACGNPATDALIQIEVFATEQGSQVLLVHEECFTARRHSTVVHDDPSEHGHIPRNARCVFCGDSLPIIGRHPYCFDLGDFAPPHRYWAHSQCMKAMLTNEAREKLPF